MPDNKSFILRGVNDVTYEQRPIPELEPDEVLVSVKKTGICGSDVGDDWHQRFTELIMNQVHYLVEGRIGDFIVKDPMVLGHESAGIITKVGSNVKDRQVGDRVALEPGKNCRVCEACKSSRYELCPDIIFAATPPYDGTLARFYKLPADMAYKLPKNLSLEEGAMMEPLSVAVHAVSNLGNFRTGQSIAVFGAGPVGLLCMAVAKALGANRVVAIDIVDKRIEFAKEFAATDSFKPPPKHDGEKTFDYSVRSGDQLKSELGLSDRGSNSIDLVIDASGVEVSIQTGLHIIKVGGVFVQVGMGKPEASINMIALITKEIQMKGSFRYGYGDYPMAISLCAQGKLDLKPLITHRYTFEDAKNAFEATRKGSGDDGKLLIKAIISGPDTPIDQDK